MQLSIHALTFAEHALTSQWRHNGCDSVSKSPASRLFTQPFIQTQIKENIKAPCHWPLCGEFTGTGEFPAQMASNAENVSIWWRYHAVCLWMRNYIPHKTMDMTTEPYPNLINKRGVKYVSNLIRRMLTSPNGNIFRVTGHLCGEFTGHRWIPPTNARDAELWCFLWSASE